MPNTWTAPTGTCAAPFCIQACKPTDAHASKLICPCTPRRAFEQKSRQGCPRSLGTGFAGSGRAIRGPASLQTMKKSRFLDGPLPRFGGPLTKPDICHLVRAHRNRKNIVSPHLPHQSKCGGQCKMRECLCVGSRPLRFQHLP